MGNLLQVWSKLTELTCQEQLHEITIPLPLYMLGRLDL